MPRNTDVRTETKPRGTTDKQMDGAPLRYRRVGHSLLLRRYSGNDVFESTGRTSGAD